MDSSLSSNPQHLPASLALGACSLSWSSIILLLLPYPLLAPLRPPVCYTLGHYHLVRLTGFGEETVGVLQGVLLHSRLPSASPEQPDFFVIVECPRAVSKRSRRGGGTVSESAWISLSFLALWEMESVTLSARVGNALQTWVTCKGRLL